MTTTRVERVPRNGSGFDLHTWVPDAGGGPAILLLQEIFGVGSFIRGVAERLAGMGYVVGAPDLYWRIRPGYEANHDEAGLSESLAMVGQLDAEQAVGDSIAALDHLGDLPEVTGRPAVLGYCLGGSLAYNVAVGADPSCCVSYYGSAVPDLLGALDAITCPVLFHFGDADDYIPF
jgi:carboxymethylenebutenolidase